MSMIVLNFLNVRLFCYHTDTASLMYFYLNYALVQYIGFNVPHLLHLEYRNIGIFAWSCNKHQINIRAQQWQLAIILLGFISNE